MIGLENLSLEEVARISKFSQDPKMPVKEAFEDALDSAMFNGLLYIAKLKPSAETELRQISEFRKDRHPQDKIYIDSQCGCFVTGTLLDSGEKKILRAGSTLVKIANITECGKDEGGIGFAACAGMEYEDFCKMPMEFRAKIAKEYIMRRASKKFEGDESSRYHVLPTISPVGWIHMY